MSKEDKPVRFNGTRIVKLLRNSVLVLLFVVFVSGVYNFRTKESSTETALLSDAVSSVEFRGVFFRDEEAVTYSGDGVLRYNVSDGGKLGIGTVIAEVYASDSQIAIKNDIETLENKLAILEKIQNPGTQESAQPASLSASIEENYRNLIYCRDIKDYNTLKSDMDELLVQMSTYQIITNEVESFSQQITDINAQLAELKAQAVDPVQVKYSDRSAYFVSYCDGYERLLTREKLDSITIAELNGVTDRKSDDPTIVGKMIDGYGWYLAGVIDNSRKEYTVGESVKLRFENGADMFNAEITALRDEGDPRQTIIVLECDQFNYDLVQHRAEKCEIIKGSYHGLKVPREAIRFAELTENVQIDESEPTSEVADGDEPETETDEAAEESEQATMTVTYKGVYIQNGEQIVFKKIDVVYEGTDYVLSRVHDDDEEYLALYDDIMIEGVEIESDE